MLFDHCLVQRRQTVLIFEIRVCTVPQKHFEHACALSNGGIMQTGIAAVVGGLNARGMHTDEHLGNWLVSLLHRAHDWCEAIVVPTLDVSTVRLQQRACHLKVTFPAGIVQCAVALRIMGIYVDFGGIDARVQEDLQAGHLPREGGEVRGQVIVFVPDIGVGLVQQQVLDNLRVAAICGEVQLRVCRYMP